MKQSQQVRAKGKISKAPRERRPTPDPRRSPSWGERVEGERGQRLAASEGLNRAEQSSGRATLASDGPAHVGWHERHASNRGAPGARDRGRPDDLLGALERSGVQRTDTWSDIFFGDSLRSEFAAGPRGGSGLLEDRSGAIRSRSGAIRSHQLSRTKGSIGIR
jgi:hypothetical protein